MKKRSLITSRNYFDMTTQTLKKWNKVKLGQVLTLNYGKGLPARDRVDGEYPVYGSAGIVGSHNSFVAEGPGIVVGRKGSIGEIYISKKNYYPIDTAYYVNSSDKYDIFFIYYLLKTLSLKTLNTDAAVPGLNRNIAYQQEFFLPDIPTQKQIADVLSTYDDLIENNIRRISILEQIAQAIYKEWFVNFRFPDYEKVKMVDSGTDFGKIPEGWTISSVGSILDIKSGHTFKSKSYTSKGLFKIVTIKNVHDGKFVDDFDYIPEIPRGMHDYCRLTEGDILLSLTGNVGRVCIVYGENLLLNQRVGKIVPKDILFKNFIYSLFRSDNFKRQLELLSNGIAQQNLSPVQTLDLKIFLPPSLCRIRFMNGKCTKLTFPVFLMLGPH